MIEGMEPPHEGDEYYDEYGYENDGIEEHGVNNIDLIEGDMASFGSS